MKTIEQINDLLPQLDTSTLQAVLRFIEDAIEQQRAVDAFYRELATLAVTRTDLPAVTDTI